MSHLATIAEADAEYARNVGIANPQRAWILSDRDVWYANPAYTGPAVRHPDDWGYDDEEGDVQVEAAAPRELTLLDRAVDEVIRRVGAGSYFARAIPEVAEEYGLLGGDLKDAYNRAIDALCDSDIPF